MASYVLVIDQGTTSTRSVVFGSDATPLVMAQQEFRQFYPHPGWVEHDPEEIWRTVVATAREAMQRAGIVATDLAGLGITNQRETVVVWDRATGTPLHAVIDFISRSTPLVGNGIIVKLTALLAPGASAAPILIKSSLGASA